MDGANLTETNAVNNLSDVGNGNNIFIKDFEEKKAKLNARINKAIAKYEHLYLLNQRWNVGFVGAAIVFTLLTTVVGAVGDNQLVTGVTHKLTVTVLGAIAVAVQTASARFPVEERTKGFMSLRDRSDEIKAKLEYAETVADLKPIQDEYFKIREGERNIR